MTNVEFRMWLSGYMELEEENLSLTPKQIWIIHNHLELVRALDKDLDEKNLWLQARIRALSKPSSMQFMSTDFRKATDQIRKWLSS